MSAFTAPVIRDVCGTSVGVSKHRYNRERLCDACKPVAAAYMRGYRASLMADRLRASRSRARARSRAMTRLAELHPEEFERLVTEELRERD